MNGLLRNNRGMALLLTLLIISIIFVLTVQFNMSMRSNLRSSAIMGDGVSLGLLARSAFNFSRAVLVADMLDNQHDSLHESWADPEVISGDFAGVFGRGRTNINISDHSGRIQLNALIEKKEAGWVINEELQKVLRRFLGSEEFGLDQEEVDNIISALIDWIDEDDEVTGFGGAENTYYQGLENGYSCKNGPIESFWELALIRGFDSNLLYGTEEKPGILNYLTYLGNDGKININTADPLVLRALADGIDQEMVDGMVDYRLDEDNELADPKWYKAALPEDVVISPDILTTASAYFQISLECFTGKVKKGAVGIIMRDENKTRIISWEVL